MAQILDFRGNATPTGVNKLVDLGVKYDMLSRSAITDDMPTVDVIGVMSDRLGELINKTIHHTQVEDALEFYINILTKRAKKGIT